MIWAGALPALLSPLNLGASLLEPFSARLNRVVALVFCYCRILPGEPMATLPENALGPGVLSAVG
jgi:hypothetical protein